MEEQLSLNDEHLKECRDSFLRYGPQDARIIKIPRVSDAFLEGLLAKERSQWPSHNSSLVAYSFPINGSLVQ